MVVGLMFFTGIEFTTWVGELPQMIVDTSIGLVMTFAGIGEVVGLSALGAKMVFVSYNVLCHSRTINAIAFIFSYPSFGFLAVIRRAIDLTPNVSGGTLIGWLSDRIGRKICVVIGAVLYFTALGLLSLLKVGYVLALLFFDLFFNKMCISLNKVIGWFND